MAKHQHLALKRLEGSLASRKQQGFGAGPKANPTAHGAKLSQEITHVLEEHANAVSIDGVDPSLILRLEMSGIVDEEYWAKIGLTVLCEEPDKTLLLFANDIELKEFRKRLELYLGGAPVGQKNPPYLNLIEAIEAVGLAGPQDRIGKSLASLGIVSPGDFQAAQTYLLDVELFHPEDSTQAQIFVHRLEQALVSHGGTIINTYIGGHIILCRVEASGAAFSDVLSLLEVASVELPPQPDLQQAEIGYLDIGDVQPGKPPHPDAVPIGIIDSGINSGHPLLAYATKQGMVLKAGWVDADEAGHGTSVASISVYGDVSGRASAGDFNAPFFAVSARVVEADGKFPKEISVPELMDQSIRELHQKHGCRIFNVSLGDIFAVYNQGKVGGWTSKLDDLARELDILIIVSAGNRDDLHSFGEQIIQEYPTYLADTSSGLLEPAPAANVLTVGSISQSNGLTDDDAEFVGVIPICNAEEPSPFTRTGPGIRGMIKPDLVDYGGCAVWDGPTQSIVNSKFKPSVGVWAFHDQPINRLFRARCGTSFSAPLVAHKSAIILEQFPNSTANFLRSLMALTATIPAASVTRLANMEKNAKLMICGNGVTNVDYAVASDDSRVIFAADDEIEADKFVVFELPIPEVFQTTNGEREIKVSLAFDPPVRRTRADYLGFHMGWKLLRGSSEKEVFDKFRQWEKAEGDPPDFPDKNECSCFPGPQLRQKGTLQCGTFTAKTTMAAYGDKYYVAVWCKRRWASNDIKKQRFAITVQLRHSANIKLYQALTVPVQLKA